MRPDRLVLGLDPGFASLGYAVLALGQGGEPDLVLRLGVIRTKKTDVKQRVLSADDNIRRARELARSLDNLFQIGVPDAIAPNELEPRVRLVAAEKMSFPRNSMAAAKMAISWGIIVANLTRRGQALLQATPQEIKRRVTGKATASKEEVQSAMVRRYGRGLGRMVAKLPRGEHEHAFDALAAIVACLDSEEGRLVRAL